MTEDRVEVKDRGGSAPSPESVTEKPGDPNSEYLNVAYVCRSLFGAMSWRDRGFMGVALLSASLYSAGTAALPVLIKLPTQEVHRFGSFSIGHFTLIALLTGLFLLRPLFFRTHVRVISKTLKRQTKIKRPFAVSLSHETLLILTRDIPMLLLLTGSLAINLGAWAIAAAGIIFIGIYLALSNVKRHRIKRARKPILDKQRDYLFARNTRADTEAISDLPQSLLVGGAILWFGYTGQSLNEGIIASLVVNIMLASPPIRRLTKLYVKVALQPRNANTDDIDDG